MKRIPLTQGQFALVDDEDFKRFGRLKWYASKCRGGFYAARNHRVNGKRIATLLLHRVIMGSPPGLDVDHKNHNRLDCRRITNLRVCSHSKNISHRKGPNINGGSGARGVTYMARRGKWAAQICVNGKRSWLGSFSTKKAASMAYAAANKAGFGEFGGNF